MGQTFFWSVSWSAAWAQFGQDIGHRCDVGLPLLQANRTLGGHALAIVSSLRINPYCS
jgi:hypothetical protein